MSTAAQRHFRRRFGHDLSRSLTLGLRRYQGPDPLAERAAIAARVARFAETGRVAIVHGGQDCDMAQWENEVAILPAIPIAVARWVNDAYAYAEGPIWWRLERPSRAAGLAYSSRDLALEAFENGHAHVVRA